MKKKMICLMAAMIFAIATCAQNSISDINRLKRDKDYLYGEATMDTKDAALKLAYELLEVEIKDWAINKDQKISSVLASKVYDYADTIVLKRHNMVRAFAYVKKSNLKAVKGKNFKVDVNREKPLSKPLDEKVIEELKTVTSFYDLEKKMKPMKAAGEITDYGKYTTMSDPENCYLIVYDQQATVKAMLGKGKKFRKNLNTGLDDSEKNYRGCGAIWFKIKE